MTDNMISQYMVAVNSNPSLTNEIKAAIAEHLQKFQEYVAKCTTVEEEKPTIETVPEPIVYHQEKHDEAPQV